MVCSGFARLDAELVFVLGVKVHMNIMKSKTVGRHLSQRVIT